MFSIQNTALPVYSKSSLNRFNIRSTHFCYPIGSGMATTTFPKSPSGSFGYGISTLFYNKLLDFKGSQYKTMIGREEKLLTFKSINFA